jgi:hypothetical protein
LLSLRVGLRDHEIHITQKKRTAMVIIQK